MFSSGDGGNPDRKGSINHTVIEWINHNLNDGWEWRTGESSKGSVKYQGEWLCSFQTKIARFVRDLDGKPVVLLTDAKMTPTTSAHQGIVSRVCRPQVQYDYNFDLPHGEPGRVVMTEVRPGRIDLVEARYLGSGDRYGDWEDCETLEVAHRLNHEARIELIDKAARECVRNYLVDVPDGPRAHWCRKYHSVELYEKRMYEHRDAAVAYAQRFMDKTYEGPVIFGTVECMAVARARKVAAYQQPKAIEARARAKGRKQLRKLFLTEEEEV